MEAILTAKIGLMRVFLRARRFLPKATLSTLLLACAFCRAQEPAPAGGKWVRTDEIDPPTGDKVVVFTLPADEAELGRAPVFQLVCNGDGKLVHARYFADTPLRVTTGDYRHFQDPAMTPKIRIDKKKTIEPVWDIISGSKVAQIDQRTVRALLTANLMAVRYIDLQTNNFTDFFSPAGLDQKRLKRACGDNGWFPK